MPLFHNVRRSNPNPSGKFLHIARLGIERTRGDEYQGWSYHLGRRVIGTTVRRAVYNVTIADPLGNRIDNLAGYASPAKAVSAARGKIDAAIVAPVTERT